MLKILPEIKFDFVRNKKNKRKLRLVKIIRQSIFNCLINRSFNLDSVLLNIPLVLTKIELTADLKIANCYFIPFNTSLGADMILYALKKSLYYIRSYVAKDLNLKYSLELRFYFDNLYYLSCLEKNS